MHITRDSHFRHGHSTPLLATTAVGLVGAMLLTGCGSHGEDSSGAGSPSATASASAFSSPVKVKSCDETLTFDTPPKRVILMGDTDASILVKLGVMDSIIGRAGDVMADGYDADTLKKITDVPTITSSELDTGGAKLATETILDQRAGLVIGYDEGLDRAALRKAGVKVYAPDTFCPHGTGTDHASFDLVTKEVSTIGDIFGVPDKARTLNDELTGQVKDLTSQASKDSQHSAAALWVEAGNSGFYTYGTSSMVQPILEANGLRNVYDGERKRVFDATMEDVLNRDPEWIVLLAQEGDIAKTKPAFLKYKGASQLQAVRKNQVVVIPFSLTDPPTPQSIKGAVELNKLLKK